MMNKSHLAAILLTVSISHSVLAEMGLNYREVNQMEGESQVWTAANASDQYDVERLRLINVERQKVGLSTLCLSPILSQAAQKYAQDTGSLPFTYPEIINNFSAHSFVGERITADQSPQDSIDKWMNNPGYKATILKEGYPEIGFGYNKDGTYRVLALGKPSSGSTCTAEIVTPPNTDTSEGFIVTPNVGKKIWINAKINTVEKGLVNAVWKKGGDDYTTRGDRVIWGYFHASPSDVSWGSENNPDLFVKIWFDVSGRIDVNYFHISVPDITVYSSKNDGKTLFGKNTMITRYVRHTFDSDGTQKAVADTSSEIVQDGKYAGSEAMGFHAQAEPFAKISTVEKGVIDAETFIGNATYTARGDFVMWGYFYADPLKVSWGNKNNPEVFFKVWQDKATLRYDVNFFHVSVPYINVRSLITYMNTTGGLHSVDETTNKESTVSESKRYARHVYTLK